MDSNSSPRPLGPPVTERAFEADESVSHTVVTAVAEATGRSAEELPPLFEVLDPDALDRLFDRRPTNVELRFEYLEHVVVVSGAGSVGVYDA